MPDNVAGYSRRPRKRARQHRRAIARRTAGSNEPRKVKIEPLELNKETIADLTDEEAGKVQGGRAAVGVTVTVGCTEADSCLC